MLISKMNVLKLIKHRKSESLTYFLLFLTHYAISNFWTVFWNLLIIPEN